MNQPDQPSAVVRRVLPALPDIVYEQWLDPGSLAEFICPRPSTPGRIECDPRIGGHLRIEMVNPQRVVHIVGEFLELDRPNRLSFTWNSDFGGGFNSVVTITLEPSGETQTLMTIIHMQLPIELVDDHERGWGSIAAQLAEKLTAGP